MNSNRNTQVSHRTVPYRCDNFRPYTLHTLLQLRSHSTVRNGVSPEDSVPVTWRPEPGLHLRHAGRRRGCVVPTGQTVQGKSNVITAAHRISFSLLTGGTDVLIFTYAFLDVHRKRLARSTLWLWFPFFSWYFFFFYNSSFSICTLLFICFSFRCFYDLFLHIILALCLFIRLLINLFIYWFIYLFTYLPISLFIHLLIYLFIYLHIYLFIYLFI